MDFDDLIHRYFGTSDMAALTPATQAAGIDRLLVDLGLERDPARRFALWSLLYLLGASPDLEVTFESGADRDAARKFMDLIALAETDDGQP